VWAIDVLTGGLAWSSNKGQIYTPPMLRDGRIYITSLYGDVHALDAATGADLWTLPGTNPIFVEAVAPGSPGPHDDLILFVDFFGHFTAIRDLGASGTIAWSTPLPTEAGTNKDAIALSKDGTFAYVAGSAGALYKIDLATGALLDTLPVSTATGVVTAVVRYEPYHLPGDPGEFLLAAAATGSGNLLARMCDLNAAPAVPGVPPGGLAALALALACLGALWLRKRMHSVPGASA